MGPDYGKSYGDDMMDGNMAMLDGMGMGGEFQTDTEGVDESVDEAVMTLDEEMDDYGFDF